MLLGSATNKEFNGDESFIVQLLLQKRYAEAYRLLADVQPTPSILYNMALCLHHSQKYHEALSRLDSIQLAPQVGTGTKFKSDSLFKAINDRQKESDDFLNGMTEAYIRSFPDFANDAVTRLKTDCWLQLEDYAKVVATATPIAHKGYKNITDALYLANMKK